MRPQPKPLPSVTYGVVLAFEVIIFPGSAGMVEECIITAIRPPCPRRVWVAPSVVAPASEGFLYQFQGESRRVCLSQHVGLNLDFV